MRRLTALFYLGPMLVAGVGASASCAQGTVETVGEGGSGAGWTGAGGEGGLGAGGGGTGLSGPCVDGETTDCYTGPAGTENLGICEGGTATCANGSWGECVGETLPFDEICNGEDDDCSGIADDGDPNGGDPCNTGEPGPCNEGTLTCLEGMVQCVSDYTPQAEQCNDIDDDCNGEVDDGNPGGGQYCSTGQPGICQAGTMTCQGGGIECLQNQQAGIESCNSLDDDCNGLTDDGNLCSSGYSCISGYCQWICPYVYAHDGSGYRYETSVGGAKLRFGSGPSDPALRERRAARRIPQRFEPLWARLDRVRADWRVDAVECGPARGAVRAKLLAAEDELVYLRRARLAVVDHPAGYEVLSETSADWRLLKQPQRQQVVALRTAGLAPPRQALWRGQVDVTGPLSTRTDRPVRFDRRLPNFYELDFGPVRDGAHTMLVIDGWKFRELRGLSLGHRLVQPRLEVEQPDGRWREVMRVPSPRGDRKAVVVDLADVEWPSGRYRMRLWTGTHQQGQAMWYLDRVRLTEQPPAAVQVRHLDVCSAELGHSGSPTLHHPEDTSRPRLNTDDGGGSPSPPHETRGLLTRFGDVQALVAADDDRLVVMQRGDAVQLEFDQLRPPAAGLEQTYFLDVELAYKPRQQVGLRQSPSALALVEPLPYAQPTDGGEPDALAHARYLRDYQTRSAGERLESLRRRSA